MRRDASCKHPEQSRTARQVPVSSRLTLVVPNIRGECPDAGSIDRKSSGQPWEVRASATEETWVR